MKLYSHKLIDKYKANDFPVCAKCKREFVWTDIENPDDNGVKKMLINTSNLDLMDIQSCEYNDTDYTVKEIIE